MRQPSPTIRIGVVLLLLLLGACGDDDSSSSPTTAEAATSATEAATSAAEAATTAAPTESTAAESTTPTASGEPVRLGVIAEDAASTPPSENVTVIATAAEAAADAINAAGGVGPDHRPIEIVTCETRGDPNVAAQCGRDMVSQGAVALVGSISTVSGGFLPVTEAAGISSIGHFSVGPADLTATLTWPIVSGAPALIIGQGVLAGELESQKPSLVRVDLDPVAQAAQLANLGLQSSGLTVNNTVAVPPGAPDMSSYVAAATSGGTDAVIVITTPQDLANFVRALRQSGSDIPVISDSANVLRAINAGFTDEMEGVYAVSWGKPATETEDPAVAQFLEEMDAKDPDATKDDTATNAWVSVGLFAELVRDMPQIDAAAVTAALPSVTDYESGIFPPTDFSEVQQLLPGVRLFNTSVLFTQVEGGEFVPVSEEFVDVFAAAAGAGTGG
jgi:ABC-type branched-subunit amino acid transport system substrate-binding protein